MKLLKEKNWDKIMYDILVDINKYEELLDKYKDDARKQSELLLVNNDLLHAYNRQDLIDKLQELNEIEYPIETIYRRGPNATYFDVTSSYRKYIK